MVATEAVLRLSSTMSAFEAIFGIYSLPLSPNVAFVLLNFLVNWRRTQLLQQSS